MDQQTLVVIYVLSLGISMIIMYMIIKGATKAAILEALQERDRWAGLNDLQKLEENYKNDKISKKDYKKRKEELSGPTAI